MNHSELATVIKEKGPIASGLPQWTLTVTTKISRRRLLVSCAPLDYESDIYIYPLHK